MLYHMASLDSPRQKLYRAQYHLKQLKAELRKFYESKPVRFVEFDAGDGRGGVRSEPVNPMPARFGLISGDCLQCMRSCLDYLVWELVLAAGHTPSRKHMFPVAMTKGSFQSAMVRGRLEHIDVNAVTLIEKHQPFNSPEPETHPLAVLDELTNINKHRRVIITAVVGSFQRPPIDIPHMFSTLGRSSSEGVLLHETPVWTYAIFKEGAVKEVAITAVLETLSQCISEEILPKFETFLLMSAPE